MYLFIAADNGVNSHDLSNQDPEYSRFDFFNEVLICKLVLYFFFTSMLQVQCHLIFKVFTTFRNCEFHEHHVRVYSWNYKLKCKQR